MKVLQQLQPHTHTHTSLYPPPLPHCVWYLVNGLVQLRLPQWQQAEAEAEEEEESHEKAKPNSKTKTKSKSINAFLSSYPPLPPPLHTLLQLLLHYPRVIAQLQGRGGEGEERG